LQQRLLSDIRTLGLPKGTVRIGSRCLIQLLQATPASPWRDLTPRTLAALLGGLSIHPHTIRFRRQILRGYYYSELQSGFLLAASFSESSSCKRQDRNTNPIFMAEFYENNSR
jgi:hypothetical protein